MQEPVSEADAARPPQGTVIEVALLALRLGFTAVGGPAADIAMSATFYENVFGWNVRTRGDGSTAFDDSVGEVSGTWKAGRAPSRETGILFYIMVTDIDATMKLVADNGGEIVQGVGADAPEITARFRDPAGNIIGLYQERG